MLAAAVVAAVAMPAAGHADPAAYDKQYVVDLGIGAKYKPKYPGADDYFFVPYPLAKVSRFYLPGLGQFGGGKKSGFSLFPSFAFHGKREASDSPSLAGTNTVDWALEAGAGIAYRQGGMRAYIQGRQGFNGHHGQVVDVGVDITTRPTDRFTLTVGPQATWASGDFMSTYFGVTPAEAGNSGGALMAYDPGPGFESIGVLAKVEYAVTERTTFHLRGGWKRLVGDAADSPIVGDTDQFWIGAGFSREFAFDLFK